MQYNSGMQWAEGQNVIMTTWNSSVIMQFAFLSEKICHRRWLVDWLYPSSWGGVYQPATSIRQIMDSV